MKFLFGALLLLFIATTLALLAVSNPGFVMIAREPFVLETSLAVFLLLLLVAFALFYVLARLATRVIKAPEALERWRQTRRTRKSRESFQTGLLLALAGDWLKAEQALLASQHGADQPLLVWLTLAFVAHRQNSLEKRDSYLARAQQHAAGNTLAARLLQAELQQLSHQHEAALATLVDLHNTHPKQPEVVRRLLETYRKLRDWAGLTHLLNESTRQHILGTAEQQPYALALYQALLSLELPAQARAALNKAWQSVPDTLKQEPSLIAIYARQLQHQKAADESAKVLGSALDTHWNDELARLYGLAETSQPAAQLEHALDWLPANSQNPVLLLTLARIARRAGQFERAQEWLAQAATKNGGHDVEAELGRLSEARGDKEQALAHYRRALENH